MLSQQVRDYSLLFRREKNHLSNMIKSPILSPIFYTISELDSNFGHYILPIAMSFPMKFKKTCTDLQIIAANV